MKISAVIPTRNRVSYLSRTLQTLLNQTRPPDEILVIDASDDKSEVERMKTYFEGCSIQWYYSPPSVCVQRNIGIRNASGEWIFLCDDDIELESDYIQKLESYASGNEDCGVVAGRLMHLESGKWTDRYPVKNFMELCWRFIFQLSVWGETDCFKVHRALRTPVRLINNLYRKRGNTQSLAGWPLVTQWDAERFQTTIFSLGANLVKKEWLREGYDEVLDPYGIGDNYGVALNFPSLQPIHVIGSAVAYHLRADENRLDKSLTYYRRILALNYFLMRNEQRLSTKMFFLWSLFGNSLSALFKFDLHLLKVTTRSMLLILLSKNPYWRGYRKKQKTIQPVP